MTLIKRIGLGILGVGLTIGILAWWNPIRLTNALSLGLIQRLITYPGASPAEVEWYQPKQKVAGVAGEELPRTDVTSPALKQALEDVDAYAKQRESLALIVMHRGKVLLEKSYGQYAPDKLTNSFSMAKTLTGLLIGKLIEDGKIESPEDGVGQYLPWARQWANLTLAHLLQMRSGLENPNDDESLSALVLMHAGTDLPGVLRTLSQQIPPGVAYDYSNFNSQILGQVIEKLSPNGYSAYLASTLWTPLQADDAYTWLDEEGGNPRTYCCLFATARSWARVGQLLLQNGKWKGQQLIPASWIEWMRKPSPTEEDYGGQLWLAGTETGTRKDDRSEPFLAKDMFYLDGKSKQRVYVIPSRKLVIVRVGLNSSGWDDAFLPNTLIRAVDPL